MTEVEKVTVVVRHRGGIGTRVVNDVVSGSVMLNPGDAKEVEMSLAGIEHYRRKDGEIEVLEGGAAADAIAEAASAVAPEEKPPLTTESLVKVVNLPEQMPTAVLRTPLVKEGGAHVSGH
jgi:hypothetical protein